MKRLVLSIILLSSIYAQADWINIATLKDNKFYIDNSLPTNMGNYKYRVWMSNTYDKPGLDQVKSWFFLLEISCKDKGIRVIQDMSTDKNNNHLSMKIFDNESVSYAPPGSPLSIAVTKVCGN